MRFCRLSLLYQPQLMSSSRISYLLRRYLDKACTNEELEELLALIEDSRYSEQVKNAMDEMWAEMTEEMKMQVDRADAVFERVLAHETKVLRMPGGKAGWVAVAAVLVMVLFAGGYLLLNKQQQTLTATTPSITKNDIAPGGDKATLTLSDGTVIALDSASLGDVSSQGNTKIIKLNNGMLSYKTDEKPGETEVIAYNVISTPKGGQYQLILPDGSKVWLNAVSSLRFPVAFSGQNRTVELNGEAYFDIATDENAPFVVKTGAADIRVLGTEFNVMAYPDEFAPKTTVVDGSVKVTCQGNQSSGTEILKAGEQAEWKDGIVKKNNNVNIEDVIAWKNGLFQFSNASIETIMRQASRWYDIEVEYKGSTKEFFNGSLPRSVSAATLFKVFESTGFVKFKIDGRKVVVEL